MIIAATGHRPDKLGGYTEAVDNKLRACATEFLTARAPSKVISGMALGWDMAWAEAAMLLGIPVIAAIPFAGQELRRPQPSRERYEFLVAFAAERVIVCPGGYDPAKMQRRNEWMVDHADSVAALWNGSAGGTRNCVLYAKRVGKPIDNLLDVYLK